MPKNVVTVLIVLHFVLCREEDFANETAIIARPAPSWKLENIKNLEKLNLIEITGNRRHFTGEVLPHHLIIGQFNRLNEFVELHWSC